MATNETSTAAALTGRLTDFPGALLHEEVLEPQFRWEAQHLLPHYVSAEKALLVDYRTMGLLGHEAVQQIGRILNAVTPDQLTADPTDNMSDIALALERSVTSRLPVPIWHVDRSRNDLQSCVQLMFGRERTLQLAADLIAAAGAAHRLAARYLTDVMPGYTHLQAAQVITPGFFVSALTAHLLHSLQRLLATYDGINLCPLGSGAMAGQELAWDRTDLARLLAFDRPQPHALVGVASRAWTLELAMECATLATGLSRFITDLMMWAGSEHSFVELPDSLAGISSAMPQKKNYPVLERIRGRAGHATAWYVDIALTQRNTPFSNTVEVSKEGIAQLDVAVSTLGSGLRLVTAVFDAMTFRVDRMRDRCEQEYLGGFSLANRLTLDEGVPWRTAQVIVGRYIMSALSSGLLPHQADPALLSALAAELGHQLADPAAALANAFDPRADLQRKRSHGSAHPAAVSQLLSEQDAWLQRLAVHWDQRRAAVKAVPHVLDRALGLITMPIP